MRLLAPYGARFFLVARNADRLQVVADDLRHSRSRSRSTETLIWTGRLSIRLCWSGPRARWAASDCAIIAQGVLGDQAVADRDFCSCRVPLHTNLISMVSLGTWLANYFLEQGHGTLVGISSVAGDRGRARITSTAQPRRV